jgi:methylmalonyl-CoA carboxyltransferase large subunit
MNSEPSDLQQLLDAVEALRAEVGSLGERLAKLEVSAQAAETTRTQQAAADASQLSEELVATISAAIAAYLGEKPKIRQIRLLGSAAWAQYGRATIQASHILSGHHG